jgi:GNAT superfamily N-acetyltransferase
MFRRLIARFIGSTDCLLYARDLPGPSLAGGGVKVPVEFRVNCPESLKILRSQAARYGLDPRHVVEIPDQLAQGEVCISGWAGSELAFYLWVQFKHRRLARLTCVPLAKSRAAIYRAFTREDFRGRRIYPAGLQFACDWLAGQGIRRVLIDHDVRNLASEKGIVAAGFRPLGRYRVHKFFGLKWATLSNTLRDEISNDSKHLHG